MESDQMVYFDHLPPGMSDMTFVWEKDIVVGIVQSALALTPTHLAASAEISPLVLMYDGEPVGTNLRSLRLGQVFLTGKLCVETP